MDKKKSKKDNTPKKIDAKRVFTYILLLDFLILALVYSFVYNSYKDKADNLNRINGNLQSRIVELTSYYSAMEENSKKIDMMNEEIEDIIALFPAEVYEEDVLMLAVEARKNASLSYSSVNVSDRENYYDITQDIIDAVNSEKYVNPISFGKRTVQYANTTDYKNLKEVVKTIQKSEGKKVISSISYTKKGEEACIEGTIEVVNYYVYGTGKEYVPKKIPGYEAGLFDLFKLYEEAEDQESDVDL